MVAEKKRRVLYVEWVDSAAVGSWMNEAGLQEPDLCRTVGWVVKEDDTWLWLAATVQFGDPDFCQRITIPKVAITKRRRLKW